MSSIFAGLNTAPKSNSGGLFGVSTTSTSGAPQSSGTSLFSTPTTAPTGSQPSQPANSGGLFGSLSSNTTSATTGASPFAGFSTSTANTTTGATSGLFGNTSTSTAPTTKPSTFSGFGTSAPPQTANLGISTAGTSSFFGGLNAGGSSTLAPQQNGLTASTQAPLQSKPNGQNSAYFDSILDQSKKRTYAATISDDLPTLQLGLDGLRSQIRKIGGGAGSRTAESGRAHYLLAASGVDPGAAVRDLNAFTSAAGQVPPPQAREAPDTDIETYLKNLETQTTLSIIQDGLARSLRDFDAFLEENVSIEWDAQRKRIYEHFGIKPKEAASIGGRGSFAASAGASQGGFGRSRRSKAATLGGSRTGGVNGGSGFGASNMQRSVIGAAGPVGRGNSAVFLDVEKKMEASNITMMGPHDRLQRDKQNKYAEKVQSLNSARLQKHPYAICKEFSDVVNLSADTHGPDLIKAYRTLADIVGEDPSIQSLSDPRLPKERQFASAYSEGSTTAKGKALRKAIIRGGARCLERLAFEHMEEVVAKNPREANLGGIPDVINKVKAYVRVQAGRKNLAGDNSDLQTIGDDYVWALVYHLLRTGHVSEANQYVKDNAPAFRSIDRSFISYIGKYATSDDRRLDLDLQQRITNEYNQRSRIAPENSIDPYRMACYKIIGRCDLGRRTLEGIPQNIEDFAWVQLVLAREINRAESMASETYGLSEAQEVIKEIGNRFFNTKGGAEIGNSFGAFVFLQMAVGMFEDAVSYLYTYNYVDGVHLAIALDFYGLLHVSDPSGGVEELYSLTTRGQPQISLGPMAALYTRDFRAANVSAAVDYITLICLNQDLPGTAGQNHVTFCHEALRELVLESREFAELLGDMLEDGIRVEGLIEQRIQLIGLDETSDFYRTITLHAASQADDNGRVTDAVLLYHLAGEYDNVVHTVNRALGEAIHTPLGQPHEKLDPLKPRTGQPGQAGTLSLAALDDPVGLAQSIRAIYDGKPMFMQRVKGNNFEALMCLLKLQAVKEMVENGRWSQALDHIKLLDLLPLRARGDASMIRSSVAKFSALPQSLANNMPNLIFWTITCSKNERVRLTSSEFGANEGVKQQLVEDLNYINMDLMTYTSQMRYRLPAELHEALARAQTE